MHVVVEISVQFLTAHSHLNSTHIVILLSLCNIKPHLVNQTQTFCGQETIEMNVSTSKELLTNQHGTAIHGPSTLPIFARIPEKSLFVTISMTRIASIQIAQLHV